MAVPRRPSAQRRRTSLWLLQCCLLCGGVNGFRSKGVDHCISDMMRAIRQYFIQLVSQHPTPEPLNVYWDIVNDLVQGFSENPSVPQPRRTADVRHAVVHVFGYRTLSESWPEEVQLRRSVPVGGKTGSAFWMIEGTPLLLKRGTKKCEKDKLHSGLLWETLSWIGKQAQAGRPSLIAAPMAVFKCESQYYTLQQALTGNSVFGVSFDTKGKFFNYAGIFKPLVWNKDFLAIGSFMAQQNVRERLGPGLLAKAPAETARSFVQTLADDATFLSQQGVVDYSLLGHLTSESQEMQQSQDPLDFIQAGIVVAGYRMRVAIIDFFGPFDAVKNVEMKLQNLVAMSLGSELNILRDAVSSVECPLFCRDAASYTVTVNLAKTSQQLSVMPPADYALRFTKAVTLMLTAAGGILTKVRDSERTAT